MMVEPSGRVAEIAASPPGPEVGAFFDLDGTLVSGFTATAHAGDRIRRRQARIGEVLGVVEASIRYRLGRMQFERLIVRAAGYLKGESLRELDELGERSVRQPHRVPRLPADARGRRRTPGSRPHGRAVLVGADHPRRTGRPCARDHHAAVQSLRGRRQRAADRGHRAAGHLGRHGKSMRHSGSPKTTVSTCNAATSTPTATRTWR